MQKIGFLTDELWYGGVVFHADKYPLSKNDCYEFDTGVNESCNQFNPIFLSNKGRFFWCGNGGKVRFDHGTIEISNDEVKFERAGKTLKEASIAAAEKYYPATGTTPDKRAFEAPQYCSWTVFLWKQNQEKILRYARSIVEKGYKPGIIIIDDTWQRAYGVWDFNKENFPDPHAMMKELKELGFTVSMWLCPYVSPDAPYLSPGIFEHMENKRVLTDGDKPKFIHWWEGYSAMLDFRQPSAVKWINEQTKFLEEEYGAEGFKLDGGDAMYTGIDYRDASLLSSLYIDCIDNPLKEARACYKLAGKPIIQRLNDKAHLWKNKPQDYLIGLEGVLPGMLTQGLVGYYYGCPDMIGGGMSSDFIDTSKLGSELIIRWCEASILMPMVQFSYDVWNHEENRVAECCKKAMALREKLLPYIIELIENASKTNQPVVRYMEYEFAEDRFAGMKTQFMLGEAYLVAPVLDKDVTEISVEFPRGEWQDIADGEIYKEGRHTVAAPIDKLPVFKKVVG